MGILKDIDVRDLELDLISSNDEDFVSVDGGTWTPFFTIYTYTIATGMGSNGSEASCPINGC
jgi:hypothetical protein